MKRLLSGVMRRNRRGIVLLQTSKFPLILSAMLMVLLIMGCQKNADIAPAG